LQFNFDEVLLIKNKMESEKIPLRLFIQLKIIVRDAVIEAFHEFEKRRINTPGIPNDDFLSAEQAAKYLKIQLSTLYSKVESDAIPYSRSGKRKLIFSREELKKFIVNKK
jgi:excisionase family DNA binding protein